MEISIYPLYQIYVGLLDKQQGEHGAVAGIVVGKKVSCRNAERRTKAKGKKIPKIFATQ